MRNFMPFASLRVAAALTVPALLAAATVGCDYQAPESEDFRADAPPNVISGEVVLAIPFDPEQVGHVVLLATDASNPGPPEGTGFPWTFTTVPASEFTEGTNGLMSAPFTITELYDADWLVTGFMDVDNDFSALFGTFSGATCGDVIGGHIDSLATQNVEPLSVFGGMHLENVPVTLGVELPFERPAFTIENSESFDYGPDGTSIDLTYTGLFPQGFKLKSTPIHAGSVGATEASGDSPAYGGLNYDLDGPFDPTAPEECQTGFLVTAYDLDGDGEIDPHPEFGSPVLNITPQVFLTFLGTEQDANGNWIQPEDFEDDESWAGLAGYNIFALAQLHGIAQADSLDNDRDGSVDESGEKLVNTPVYLNELELMWLPAGLQTVGSESWLHTEDISVVPAGHWDVTVIADTGQTWTVPNSLAAFPSTDEGYDPARQAETLEMTR